MPYFYDKRLGIIYMHLHIYMLTYGMAFIPSGQVAALAGQTFNQIKSVFIYIREIQQYTNSYKLSWRCVYKDMRNKELHEYIICCRYLVEHTSKMIILLRASGLDMDRSRCGPDTKRSVIYSCGCIIIYISVSLNARLHSCNYTYQLH